MERTWHVYILRCADDTLYTGVTIDVDRRVGEHNDSQKGAKYTRSRRPLMLVHTEAFSTRSAACAREATIKKLSREEKLELVNASDVHYPRQSLSP